MDQKDTGKNSRVKAILKRADELQYDTDRLSAASLMTQQSHINSSRLIMVANQLTHMVNIKDPEAPLVSTGFENVLANYSSMLVKSDGEYEVVAKFEKNPYVYVLIGYDKKRKHYHAWKRIELDEHSEGFATRYNNNYIDSLEVGDVIPKGTYVTKSDSFDKYMNYRYGKNLNTVYLVSAQVLEDGILAMGGVDHMMNTYRSFTQTISLSENEILLNWYGDEDHYQSLPKIGEKTRKGILAAIRRIDNSKAPYALKKKRLRTIERGDRKYYETGRVIDIDILYNKKRTDLVDAGATKQIEKLYDQQQDYYKRLYRYMIDIVDHAGDGEYTYSDEFTIICEEAHDFVDSSAYFADSKDNIYGNMQIIVHLMDEEKLSVGSKLVGRSGNKGVISRILPPEESWKMEDGTPVHLVVATLGIVGRLNQSQMNEHEINAHAITAVEEMKATDDVDQKLHIVHKLLKYLNSDEASSFKDWCKDLSDKDKIKFCKRIEREGITVIQEPIDNANLFEIGKAEKEYPVKWQKIVFPDGRKSMHKVICSKMFYIRLKQDPLEKYSVRSRGPVNPLTTLPAKSNLKKKGLEAFSDVPVRVGEYDIEVLLAMINYPKMVADFMTENSTSWQAKMVMAEKSYLADIGEYHFPIDEEETDEEDIDAFVDSFLAETDNPNTGKKNMEAIEAYMNVLGSEIDMEVEDAPDGEWFYD